MTRDNIIRMARKAGGADISSNGWTSWVGTQSTEFFERFANLVAEHEREACAGLAEKRMLLDNNEDQKIGHHHACKSIAKDIRARGQA